MSSSIPPETSFPSRPLPSEASPTQVEDFALSPPQSQAPRLPSLRNANDTMSATNMTASSTPLGTLNAARRPNLPHSTLGSSRSGQLPQDMQAKMKAFHLSRQGAPPPPKVCACHLPLTLSVSLPPKSRNLPDPLQVGQ